MRKRARERVGQGGQAPKDAYRISTKTSLVVSKRFLERSKQMLDPSQSLLETVICNAPGFECTRVRVVR